MMQRAILFVITMALGIGSASAQPTAIVGGTVVNPEGAPIVEEATVIVEGERITAVGERASVDVPDGATVIDASGKYLIPGLTDGHVHFFQSGGLYTRPDAIDLRAVRPYADELALITERLPDTFARYLRSGITSVVDVGGPMWNLDVRAMADTMAKAPRVTVAGPLLSSVERPQLVEGDPPILRIDTPAAARAEVQRQVEAGVDLIKIWYIVRPSETPAAFRPVVEATIDAAHSAGLRVAVHATQLETARAAVEAGADILVHSVSDAPVDDAFVQLAAENDVLYTPTIMVGERYREVFAQQLDLTVPEHQLAHPDILRSLFDLRTLPDSLVSSGLRRLMQSNRSIPSDSTAIDNLRVLHDAGVSIVAGTDAGNIGTPHGPAMHREIELMRAAGLSPREILTTATIGGARLAGRDDLGTIEAGQLADLVVLDDDPRTDITHWSAIHRVVKGGHVFAPDDLVNPSPAAVAQQQANAYNARDLEAFLSFYAPDVQAFTFPDRLMGKGIDSMRRNYGRLFEQTPQLHVEIVNRMHLGNTVIDQELVRGMSSSGPVEVIAIYRVTDGRIDRVRFVRE